MENGRGLDLGLLPELAAVLDCTVTYLLGLTTEPWAWQPTDSVGHDRPVPRLRAVNPIGPNGADVLDPTGQGGTGGSEGSRATSYRTRWRDPGSGP